MPNDNWKTLRVPPDAYAKAQEQRQAAGRTWGEQIVRPEGGEVARYEVGSAEPVDYVEGWPEDASIGFPTADVKEAVREVLREELGARR